MLKREYKIVKSVSTVFGKWPQTYGNAFFTDSKWLLTDFYEMLQSNLGVYMERNEFVEDERVFAQNFTDLWKRKIDSSTLN